MQLGKIIAICTAASIFGVSAEAKDLRLLSSWPSNQVYVREIALPWLDKVAETSSGYLNISFAGPDVIPPMEQTEPVQAGVFDLVFTHPAYHAGSAPLGLAIDGIAADPVRRRESGVLDALDAYYQGFGMKLIGAFPVGSIAFNFALKEPIDGAPSLQGRKIRGTPSYNPVIEALGGVPVVLGMADIYSSLQTGVIDGAATTVTGMHEAKWHEVSSYLSRPAFGQVSAVLLMNLDAWNSLEPDQRDVLNKAAVELEIQTAARFDMLAAEEEKQLLAAGMQLTQMPAEDAERLDALWEAGVWEGAMPAGAAAENLLKLSREAGLSK